MNSIQGRFKGKKILVVEDDAALRGVVCKILEDQGAETRFAENGLVAKTIIELNELNFDLVISDVRMPEMDGITLLTQMRKICPTLPFLIFTGFAEVLEAQSAFDLGAKGFLAKPFRLVNLTEKISEILFPPPELLDEPALNEDNFCKVPVDDFLSASKLPSDIYIMVAAGKFIKIARENSEIDIARIQIYKDKKIHYFYVKTEDFKKYSGLNLKVAQAAARSGAISLAKKLHIYRHTSEMLMQQIFVSGLEKDLCEQAGEMVTNTLKIVAENDDLFEYLVSLQARGDKLYTHSVAVAVYSVMIAKKLGWNSTANQYKLLLAGLFHDIGMKELPQDLHDKQRSKMTPDEIKRYESHPNRGRDLLLDLPEFPGDVAQIVFQHHENQIGTGYPMGIAGAKIHPLAKVIRLADEFTERFFISGCHSAVEAVPVLERILQSKGDEFEPQAMAALCELFSFSHPALKQRRPAS